METIHHSQSTECPPGTHDLIPFLDNDEVAGTVCQRCGKRTYEHKGSSMNVNENGGLEYYPFTAALKGKHL